MFKAKQKPSLTAPAPVTVTAPPPPKPAKRNPSLTWVFHALKYSFWPQWGQKYLLYMRWAKGNDDRLDVAQRKFWTWLTAFAVISLVWWIIFAITRGWHLSTLFNSVPFLVIIWITFNLPMNSFGLRTFMIPDWTPLLSKNERLHWTEIAEPTKEAFVLGTTGTKWIPYGWMPPLYERTGKAIIGDLGKGVPNAINYLIACGFGKADTICFCLDGKPASGVGFRHLRDLKNVFIAEDFASIIKTVKYLLKVLRSRIEEQSESKNDIEFPRVLIVCDPDISQTFLPGFFLERERMVVYKWPQIHKEMIELLHNGHSCDMHIIAAMEPSETWLAVDNKNRPYFEEISFHYSLPRETEKGMVWTKPHEHPFLDVFSVKIDGERVIGKMPVIPEKELTQWIEIKSEMAGEATKVLWKNTLEKIPDETIGERIERDELIWVNGNLVKKSRIDSGTYQPEKIDLGAQEEFYRLHHEPKNGTNGTNGKQAELEIEKK